MATDGWRPLAVGVVTRNRPKSLLRCLASLTLIEHLVDEVIVVDDASDSPIRDLLALLPSCIRLKLRLVEQPGREGYIVARNTIMRLAAADYVLLLDDDAHLIGADGVRQSLELLGERHDVAAIACAQAEPDGSPWPPSMQPSSASYPCYVPSFIGFAHVLRRSVFFDCGGYREALHFYGEEKDYCLRLLDAGHHVVFLPDARVAHDPDPSTRSSSRYLRFVIRNDCLCALYNEPLPLPLFTVPLRLMRYLHMRRTASVHDPGGLRWILADLVRNLRPALRQRKPVRWTTLRRWCYLRRTSPDFSLVAGSHPRALLPRRT